MDTQTKKPDGPDLYVGLAFEMDEIELGMNVLKRHLRDTRACFDAQQTVSLALMAAEFSKVANQLSLLSAHMSKIAGKHINRNRKVTP